MTQARARIRRRFTILGLILIVAAVLVANLVWYGMGVFVDEMTAVGASLLAAPYLGLLIRRLRPFCIGFALFSWGYMLVLFSPLGHQLPTTRAFDLLIPTQTQDWASPRYNEPLETDRAASQLSLLALAQMLTTLIFGTAGGSAFHLLAGHKIDDDPVVDSLEGRLLNPEHAGRITDELREDRQIG